MRLVLRILGVAIGACALLVGAFASIFRLEGGNDLEMILNVDVVIGLALAVAVVMARIPAVGTGTWQWHCVTAAGAFLIGSVVSGGLAWTHLEQHRIRSTPPVLHERRV